MTRERLRLIHSIRTDKAAYFVYDTETIQNYDAVNIEIERIPNGTSNPTIILEKEIFDESWGGMCGDSFSRLVLTALDDLRKYIKKEGENITEDIKL